jgi:MinD-like ATPase involved in chromosome partitioning or flagellar assembly
MSGDGTGAADRLMVEVVGPGGRRWLALPAAAPVAELVPELVRLVGGGGQGAPDAGDWVLAPPVGRPLEAGASLRSSGIRAGSALYLVSSRLAADADGVLPPHALVDIRTPVQRATALLPRRLTGWQRIGTAMRAATGAAPPAPAPPPPPAGTALHPAAFAQSRPAPPWRRGWQAWRAQDYLRRLEAATTDVRLRRGVTVAVVSPGPRAGRTVVASLLGTLMARLRRDRVIAVDASPAPDSLATLLTHGRYRYLDDLQRELDRPDVTLTQLDACLGFGSHGLRVLSAPADPGRRARLDARTYAATLDWLERFAGLVIVDCAPGLDGPIEQAALGAADQVLVVTDAGPESGPPLGLMVDGLRRDGRSVLVVVNEAERRAAPGAVGRLAVSAPEAEALLVIPWSPAGMAQLVGGGFDWEHAPAEWRRAAHELAAALAADWSRLGLTV